MRIPRIAVLIAVSAGMLAAVQTAPARGDGEQTRAALRTAYQREVAAVQLYIAFAKRAEEEGYHGVCDLFDALVRAEQVHASIFAFRLEQMDETPMALPTRPVVGTTAENLAAAYESEMLERRTVYTRLADMARGESQYDAVAGFGYAGGAELTHARALATAWFEITALTPEHALLACTPAASWFGLADLTADHTYYVCTGCGRVRTEYSSAGCDCGAMAPKALATRLRLTTPIPIPVGPVATR